jgi:hypothetical protein
MKTERWLNSAVGISICEGARAAGVRRAGSGGGGFPAAWIFCVAAMLRQTRALYDRGYQRSGTVVLNPVSHGFGASTRDLPSSTSRSVTPN